MTNNPTPSEIRALRLAAGLTQKFTANLVHASLRALQQWESGERHMHLAFWELLQIKIKQLQGQS